jgi:hypothetical protein
MNPIYQFDSARRPAVDLATSLAPAPRDSDLCLPLQLINFSSSSASSSYLLYTAWHGASLRHSYGASPLRHPWIPRSTGQHSLAYEGRPEEECMPTSCQPEPLPWPLRAAVRQVQQGLCAPPPCWQTDSSHPRHPARPGERPPGLEASPLAPHEHTGGPRSRALLPAGLTRPRLAWR